MKLNKKGSVFAYTYFLIFITLNMFIFVVLCNLNTKKVFEDKSKYYHILILEERAKRHVVFRIKQNNLETYETEKIYYGDDYIYYSYVYDTIDRKYTIKINIYHHNITEIATIYYDLDTNELIYELL